jgi:lysylphosphatidylglycerol synthetase-like protein (DUF2156 family)
VELFLAISQGIGASLAAGVRPFIASLVVGALARGDLGVDFEGTDYSFLEAIWWLAAMVVLVGGMLCLRRGGARIPTLVLLAPAVAIGALEFAGSLADEGYAPAPGLAAGAAAAAVGFLAAQAFLGGAVARLRESEAASFVELYGLAAAVAIAALAVLAPPASYVALAFCAWLLLARRQRAQRKYEGLRILRGP